MTISLNLCRCHLYPQTSLIFLLAAVEYVTKTERKKEENERDGCCLCLSLFQCPSIMVLWVGLLSLNNDCRISRSYPLVLTLLGQMEVPIELE